MQTSDFSYSLPPELVAQHPANERDASRLLVLNRATRRLDHRVFRDLPAGLRPGDLLVLNDSKVIRARLRGTNAGTGGSFEILLTHQNRTNDWWAMLRPGKRARLHTRISVQARGGGPSGIEATVAEAAEGGERRLVFHGPADILDVLDELGEVPLPPYIRRVQGQELASDAWQYQTVYASEPGSVAAPTAGMHFTEALLARLRARGVGVCKVTLHVGPGTFAPVKTKCLTHHTMHEERFSVTEDTAAQVNAARREGRRIVAVGTTTVRVLESVAAAHDGQLAAGAGSTRIFIYPPFRFRLTDALVTNFHLPCSTLLMLVSAFAEPGGTGGRDLVLQAYAEAIRNRYRFYSYGDAMLIF